VLERRHRIDEPLHRSVVEGAEQDPAALHRHDQHRRRHDVLGVGVAPHFLLERDDALAVFERDEIANVDHRRCGCDCECRESVRRSPHSSVIASARDARYSHL
jgi:hypothetical protein